MIITEYTKTNGTWSFCITNGSGLQTRSDGYPTKALAKHCAADILRHLRKIDKVIVRR